MLAHAVIIDNSDLNDTKKILPLPWFEENLRSNEITWKQQLINGVISKIMIKSKICIKCLTSS